MYSKSELYFYIFKILSLSIIVNISIVYGLIDKIFINMVSIKHKTSCIIGKLGQSVLLHIIDMKFSTD